MCVLMYRFFSMGILKHEKSYGFSETIFKIINYAFIETGPMKSPIVEVSQPCSNWKWSLSMMGNELIS